MLSSNQRRYLRAMAHHRKPVVTVGAAGVSEAVIAELEQALDHHELVKVKLPALAAGERKRMLERLCSKTDAECVQSIGRVGVVYRRGAEPAITLPEP